MNTADLHPKRFDFSLTVTQLRLLADELLAMEHAPHQAPILADKQLERDRAGEQLLTHIGLLLEDAREKDEGHVIADSLPLLRAAAKFLLTAFDRCRRQTLAQAQAAGAQAAGAGVQTWDDLMRRLADQHGVTSSMRELVQPVTLSREQLAALGLAPGALFNETELLA